MYYVYVLKGKNGITYVGQTNNLLDRLARHNGNRSRYTKGKGPFKLVLSEEYGTRSEAVRREKSLKGGKGREWLKKMFTNGA